MSDPVSVHALALHMHDAAPCRLREVNAGRQAPRDVAMRRTALVIGVDTARNLGANLMQRLEHESFRVFLADPDMKSLVAAARRLAARRIDVVAVVADAAAESEIDALFDHADAEGSLELVVFNENHDLLNGAVRRWKAVAHDTSSPAIGPAVGVHRNVNAERDLHTARGQF